MVNWGSGCGVNSGLPAVVVHLRLVSSASRPLSSVAAVSPFVPVAYYPVDRDGADRVFVVSGPLTNSRGALGPGRTLR